ncbi:glutamate--tRNA ligase, partial [candidate division GN15 bacterium]|nr:glutamate--tRNA ligase [candidate division GN15 bacterium]
RLGDKDVGEYRYDGILPEAMVNYLSLIGWSPKTDNEIYTRDELIRRFDGTGINKANGVFDEEKLLAFNKAHLQRKTDHELAEIVAPMIVDAGQSTKYWLETRWEYLRQVVGLFKDRMQRPSDFVERSAYFFTSDFEYDPKAEAKQFKPEAADLLAALADRFEALSPFDKDSIEAALVGLAEEREVKNAKLIHPTRLAVSGMSVGPGLYDMLAVLGQRTVVERMRNAVTHIQARQCDDT